ncbi:MAG: lipocalin family protein [Ignavibacteria bacterium]
MIRFKIIITVLSLFVCVNLFAQDTTTTQSNNIAQDSTTTQSDNPLVKVWGIEEFIENGKKSVEENMLEIVVDFREDRQYTYWEENESTDGVWEMSEDGATIYFDKDTENEMVWEIITLEPTKLEVKMSYGKSKYKYIFSPKVRKVIEEM